MLCALCVSSAISVLRFLKGLYTEGEQKTSFTRNRIALALLLHKYYI